MSVSKSRGRAIPPFGRARSHFFSRRRAWWALGGALALAVSGLASSTASYADNAGGCDFAATGTTPSCLGALSPSTFAGGDGNLNASPTDFGTTDWSNVAGLNTGFDLASGKGDNSFGQGSKEDSPNISVVSGSIPPNKSDLMRFYEASELKAANNHNYLYLGWERNNALGTANFDFEINQSTQPDLTTAGAKTLVRTAGDLLVTFDFNNGGGRPVIGLLRWLTSGAGNTAGQCFSSNALPCWGNHLTLDGTDSIGAVNNLGPVTDPLSPTGANYQNPVPALMFGETAIDLTAADVIPIGTCRAFGSAMVRSRSSSAFTAEIKDFIAPIPVNISNCGAVKIIKHTDPRGLNQKFSYTSNLPQEAAGDVGGVHQGGVACTAGGSAGVGSGGAFCLNDTGNTTGDSASNTIYNNTVPVGTYTVTEGADPTGFAFDSLTCSTGGAVNGRIATITVTAGTTVTCTYVNDQQLGALMITKTSSKASADPLQGAKFSIKDPDGNAITNSPFTTDANGEICVDGLTALGNYTVKETVAPTGYAIDDSSDQTMSVTATNAHCTDTVFGGATHTWTDTPLTDISVNATSQVTGGTKSSINCVKDSDPSTSIASDGTVLNPVDPADASATDLLPGSYTCTIVIDP